MALQSSRSPPKALPSPSSTDCGSADAPSSRLRSRNHKEKSTPSKRKTSGSIREEAQYPGGLSLLLSPHSRSEGTLSLDSPMIPDALRPPLSKKARSTPEHITRAGDITIDNKPIPIPEFKKKPNTSPSGKYAYAKRGGLGKHENRYENSKDIPKKPNRAEVQGEMLDSERSSTTEVEEIDRATTTENKTTEVCQVDSNIKHHKIDGKPTPDPESRKWTHGRPSAEAKPTDPNVIQAMTLDGTTLDLEDEIDLEGEIYLEGKPQTNSSGLRSDSVLVHDRLKERLERKLTPKDQRGYVYIFADPARPHLHKIGRAKRPLDRRKQLDYSCGLHLKLVGTFEVENHFRTESLIHAYISDLCRPYTCDNCGTRHGEWFEITNKSAQAYVEKWAIFMTQERPYNADSKELQPFIRSLVRLRERLLKDLGNEELRKAWGQILSPTAVDRFGYRLEIVGEMAWKYYWPVNAMIAWTITFIAIQHPATFAFMVASVIGTLVVVAQDYHHLR